MSSDSATPDTFAHNTFTHGRLGAIFAKTALPVIFVMSMNGLLTVVDAIFLGVFVGREALGAVTLMFPIYMLIIALATLVASGMSSILARHLGAGRLDDSRAVFAGAHGLALAASAGLIVLFLAVGHRVTLLAASGSAPLADMGYTYLSITVFFSPVFFVLAINSSALRNEGRAGFMAAMSLLVTLSNIGFNYVLIAIAGLGVAGSALGTVMAQALAIGIILVIRLSGRVMLRPSALVHHSPMNGWPRILALGAPRGLNFIGIALVAAAVIAALQIVASGAYEATVSAYGIITRIMTFAFLPLLGLSQTLQSIVGNNYGAALWRRSDNSLRLGLTVAFVYCLALESVLALFARPIGRLFVDDAVVVSEVARIMPVMVAMFFAAGPLIMIGSYFQAIGDAGRAAVLGLSKPFAFAIPLTYLLPLILGERGIWLASPIAEISLLCLTTVVLVGSARRRAYKWGLFTADARQAL